jgi:hypothetical protein
MKRGEIIISLVLSGAVLLLFIMLQQKWQTPSLKEVASSAEQYLLRKTGSQAALPQIPGYERVRVYDIDRDLRGALYRSNAVTLGFAPGRLVIYDRAAQPVFQLPTLEGAREMWTAIYDFNGRQGLPAPNAHPHSLYLRDLSGNGRPDIIIGQYSGGNRCCTTVTLLEPSKESLNQIGRIDGLDGWPFSGLEVRRIGPGPAWDLVVHRPQMTACGGRDEAADSIAIYAYADGQYQDQTSKFGDYLQGVLHTDLARWSREKSPSPGLLESLAVLYAQLGQPDRAKKFFSENLTHFLPGMKTQGTDPKACLDDVNNLIDSFAKPPS